MTARRMLVCGSRDWCDPLMIRTLLELTCKYNHPTPVLVHGGARGADNLADAAGRSLGMTVEAFPADWKGKGRAAGPLRNKQMLDSGVDTVVAFKDGFDFTLQRGGTEHMVRIARDAGVACRVLGHNYDVWVTR